jgi:hypothetical protein
VQKVREHPGLADMEFDHMQVWIMNTSFSYFLLSMCISKSWIFLLMYCKYTCTLFITLIFVSVAFNFKKSLNCIPIFVKCNRPKKK